MIMRSATAVHRRAFAERLPGQGLPSGTTWFLVVVLLSAGAGCSSSKYLTLRKVPRSPLEGPLNLLSRQGPQPTERTVQTLRRHDLETLHKQDPAAALGRLQEEIVQETTADKIHAFSELAYIAGYKAEALGRYPLALNLYGAAAFHAYDYLFDPSYDSLRNPYDPQFRRACDLYNGALEAALRLMQRNDRLRPGESLLVDTGAEQIRVDVVVLGSWKAEDIDRLEFVSDYQLKGLKNHHHSFGLGVPLIAVRRPGPPDDPVEKYYPPEMSFPLTAFLRFLPAGADQLGRAGRCCVLELHDPMDACATIVSNRLVPLETDLSTPLGYRLEKQQKKSPVAIATLGLLNPGGADSIEGLYMVEPYDPRKIPVLMVHGLWSSPMTWMEMFNDLLAYPEIRANYQFWFYLYPTGEPFWYAANQLRTDLAEVRATLDPHAVNPVFDRMVLVGHSMGGLVSMMQTINSGEDLWRLMSDVPFEELRRRAGRPQPGLATGVLQAQPVGQPGHHVGHAPSRQPVRQRLHALPGPQVDPTAVAQAVGHSEPGARESGSVPRHRPADDLDQHRLVGPGLPDPSGPAGSRAGLMGALSQCGRRDSGRLVVEPLH